MTVSRADANRALEEALSMCASAFEWDGIRVGFLLFVESQSYDSDGTSSTVMGYHMAEGQSWTRTLGILRGGTLRLEHDYVTSD